MYIVGELELSFATSQYATVSRLYVADHLGPGLEQLLFGVQLRFSASTLS